MFLKTSILLFCNILQPYTLQSTVKELPNIVTMVLSGCSNSHSYVCDESNNTVDWLDTVVDVHTVDRLQ